MDAASILAACALIIAVYSFVRVLLGWKENGSMPEPPAWPLLRHMPYFWGKDQVEVSCQLWNGMSDADIFRCDTLEYSDPITIVPRDVEAIKTMFSDDHLYLSRPDIVNFLPILKHSITNLNGSIHRAHRTMLAKAFTPENLKNYTLVFKKYAQLLCELLKKSFELDESAKVVDPRENLVNFSLAAIIDAGFGCKSSSLEDNSSSNEFAKLLRHGNSEMSFEMRVFVKFLKPILSILPFGPIQSTRRICDASTNFLQNMIEERQKNSESSQETGKSILDVVLQANEGETSMTKEELISNMLFILIAGHDSTAVSLSWCIYALGKYPEYQDEIRKETRDIVEDMNDLSYESLLKMKKLNNFIREVLRMYPPVSFNNRSVSEKCKYGNYTLQKGTKVQLWTTAIHQDERFYDDPYKFDPSRFENPGSIKRGSFVPFSYGPHVCLGERFAILEMKVALVYLVREFQFSADPLFCNYKCDYPVARVVKPPITVKMSVHTGEKVDHTEI